MAFCPRFSTVAFSSTTVMSFIALPKRNYKCLIRLLWAWIFIWFPSSHTKTNELLENETTDTHSDDLWSVPWKRAGEFGAINSRSFWIRLWDGILNQSRLRFCQNRGSCCLCPMFKYAFGKHRCKNVKIKRHVSNEPSIGRTQFPKDKEMCFQQCDNKKQKGKE